MMRDKRRINNKGMSLVELMIAITILAIITVPLLHAFVSSARINRKAKQTQRLTTIGQDIMEGLKAYSVEDLAYEFDYPTVSSCSAHPSGFQLIKPSLVGTNSTEVASRVKEVIYDATNNKYEAVNTSTQSIRVTGAGPSVSYDFDKEGSKNKTFYFVITNVSAENSTSGSYKADILIKIDPKKYKNPSAGGTVSNNTAQHNDKILADLNSMDTSRDAFFLESGTQINNAYNELTGKGAVISNAEDITKEIEVTVGEDALNNKTVTYKFKYKADGYSVEYPTNPALSTLKYADLDNVYLFYLPSYGGVGDMIQYKDTRSADTKKLKFTLVKRQITATDDIQIPDPDTGAVPYKIDDYAKLNSKELTYKCTLTIPSTNKPELRTNIKTNLATLIPDPANTIGASGILTDTLAMVNLPTGVTNETVAGIKDEDRIFDVTIDIYEEGTIDDAITAGTVLPADKHLVTLKGNMN